MLGVAVAPDLLRDQGRTCEMGRALVEGACSTIDALAIQTPQLVRDQRGLGAVADKGFAFCYRKRIEEFSHSRVQIRLLVSTEAGMAKNFSANE
ncbi:hypothetical protein AMK20_08950 [Streptomyces sp. TSRI0261]|nr:hypothetical protein AMK20_08950 [Streptomyces sp. TSRI0261]